MLFDSARTDIKPAQRGQPRPRRLPLPVWVISDWLGVPDVDRDKLAYWSNTMLSLTQYTQQEIDAAQARRCRAARR